MDKILRRFCSQEVQIMIAKMEEDYSVFSDYDNAWRRLLELERCRTRIENYCVAKVKNRVEKGHARQQYLARILTQHLTPKTLSEFEDTSFTSLSASQINQLQNSVHQRHIQAHKYLVQGLHK